MKNENDLMNTTEEQPERAVVVAVDTGEYDVEGSLAEMRALCETAGAEVIAEVVQRRERADNASFLGAGKLEETRELCERLDVELVIADAELTGVKQRNMERALGVDVIDRTTLILDIFARSAKTAEGKLQVELAQLNYRLPRLTGAGGALSRIGGSATGGSGGRIGTRGPGETKLENDKRYIRGRIAILKERLRDMEKQREVARGRREKTGIPVVSLVGYTNVGKSTLLNALTGSDVLSEDKLFATLDPTARKLSVGDLQQIILVDTVGFVSRLPHNLVEAFKSTLEEIKYSDLIIKVLDASSDAWVEQSGITDEVIAELGCADIPVVTVFNKCDRLDTSAALPGLALSAKTGKGLDLLLSEISKKLSERVVRCVVKLPFDKLCLASFIREHGNVLSEEYTEDGAVIRATIERASYPKIEEYVIGI